MTEEMDPLLRKWYTDDEKYDLRHTFNINSNSIVFDVGGYDGYWSETIYNKYNCNIFIFEPVSLFYNDIIAKINNEKIRCLHYGLDDKTHEHIIYINKDASNIYMHRNNDSGEEKILLKSIIDVINELNINNIDVLKINAEGAEYGILESLILHNKIIYVKEILVQFHLMVDNAVDRKKIIESELSKTHQIIFDYDMLWQKWALK